MFTEEESRVVFGNVALLTNYNKALLKDLRARVQAWHDQQRIGDIFERMLPFLKMYEQYCTNHHASIKALIELKKKKDVQKFLAAGLDVLLVLSSLRSQRRGARRSGGEALDRLAAHHARAAAAALRALHEGPRQEHCRLAPRCGRSRRTRGARMNLLWHARAQTTRRSSSCSRRSKRSRRKSIAAFAPPRRRRSSSTCSSARSSTVCRRSSRRTANLSPGGALPSTFALLG